jgi:hypothetical protein
MEPNPSHKYRESRPSIEQALDIFDNEEFLMQAAVNFFGLAKYSQEGGFATHHNLITGDELEAFKIFCKHVGKRIINKYGDNDGGGIQLYKKDIDIKDLPKMSESEKYIFFNNLFHDISHSVGQVALHGNDTSITPVQPYLRNPPSINNEVNIEDELRGFIFGSLYYPSPFANRSHIHLEASDTYEKFKTAFIEKTIRAALDDNNATINNTLSWKVGNDEDEEKLFKLKKDAEKLGKEIIQNPPEDVLHVLEYIWKHKENPRVLVDLFFIQTGDYIKKLQKRRDYLVKEANWLTVRNAARCAAFC